MGGILRRESRYMPIEAYLSYNGNDMLITGVMLVQPRDDVFEEVCAYYTLSTHVFTNYQ